MIWYTPSVASFDSVSSPSNPPYSSAVKPFSKIFSSLGSRTSTVNDWPANADLPS